MRQSDVVYEHSYRGRQCGFNKKHQSTKDRTQGFTADPVYEGEVFAYVGLPQNLKDLKDAAT